MLSMSPDDEPSARKSRIPSSCGLTVLVHASVHEVDVTLSWGDYVTLHVWLNELGERYIAVEDYFVNRLFDHDGSEPSEYEHPAKE
jgi:hypothetical protein